MGAWAGAGRVFRTPARRLAGFLAVLAALAAAAFGVGHLAPQEKAASPVASHSEGPDRFTVEFSGAPIALGRNGLVFQIAGVGGADRRRAARYAPAAGGTALVLLQRLGADAGPVSVPASGTGDTWRADLTVPGTGAWWLRVVVRPPSAAPTTFDVPLWIPGSTEEETP